MFPSNFGGSSPSKIPKIDYPSDGSEVDSPPPELLVHESDQDSWSQHKYRSHTQSEPVPPEAKPVRPISAMDLPPLEQPPSFPLTSKSDNEDSNYLYVETDLVRSQIETNPGNVTPSKRKPDEHICPKNNSETQCNLQSNKCTSPFVRSLPKSKSTSDISPSKTGSASHQFAVKSSAKDSLKNTATTGSGVKDHCGARPKIPSKPASEHNRGARPKIPSKPVIEHNSDESPKATTKPASEFIKCVSLFQKVPNFNKSPTCEFPLPDTLPKQAEVYNNAEIPLAERLEALHASEEYKNWWKSFQNPRTYDFSLYYKMMLTDDWELMFSSDNNLYHTLQIPIVLLHSLCPNIPNEVKTFKCQADSRYFFKDVYAFAFWWLMNFICNETKAPDARGMAQVLQMAKIFEIHPIYNWCRELLHQRLDIKSFHHVFNVAAINKDEELLDLCGQMIATWTDELLSSPSISIHSKETLLEFLTHPNFNPTKEVLVLEAIICWERNRQRSHADNVDMRKCLKQVRFLQMTDREIVEYLFTSGVVEINEMDEIMSFCNGQFKQKWFTRRMPFFEYCQKTPHEGLLKTVKFGKFEEYLFKQIPNNIGDDSEAFACTKKTICLFKVDKPILIRKIICWAFLHIRGTFIICNKERFFVSKEWDTWRCSFDQPLQIKPGVDYYLVFMGSNSIYECNEEIYVDNGVIFEGMLFCPGLSIEFAIQSKSMKSLTDVSPKEAKEAPESNLDKLTQKLYIKEENGTQKLDMKEGNGTQKLDMKEGNGTHGSDIKYKGSMKAAISESDATEDKERQFSVVNFEFVKKDCQNSEPVLGYSGEHPLTDELADAMEEEEEEDDC